MKKLFTMFLACMMIFCFTIEGKSAASFLLKGGVNFSTLQWDPALSGVEETPRIGLIVGCGFEFEFEKLALEIDVLYEQKGEKISSSFDTVKSTDIEKLDYLTIPVILKGMSKDQPVRVFYGAGLGVGVLLSAKDDWEITEDGITMSGSQDVKDMFKSTDIIAVATIGLDISNFIIEARANYGLGNIYNGSGTGTINTLGLALMTGYKF
ncbi:MAG: PorT family protein [Spirochaetes bacterium]|nr:PorT family protein [Spirochaetota bacterium]